MYQRSTPETTIAMLKSSSSTVHGRAEQCGITLMGHGRSTADACMTHITMLLCAAQVAQKREALLAYRHLFTFNERPTHPLAASDVVAEMMCTYAKLGRRRRRRPIVPHPAIPQGF